MTIAGPDDGPARCLRVLVLAAVLLLLLLFFRAFCAPAHVRHAFARVLLHPRALMLGSGRVTVAMAAGLGRRVGSECGAGESNGRCRKEYASVCKTFKPQGSGV